MGGGSSGIMTNYDVGEVPQDGHRKQRGGRTTGRVEDDRSPSCGSSIVFTWPACQPTTQCCNHILLKPRRVRTQLRA